MFAIIASAMAAGALLMGRTKPATRVRRKTILGRVSGKSYQVEDFEDAGFLVAKAEDGSASAALKREGGRGLSWHRSLSGSAPALRALFADLCAAPAKPASHPKDPPPPSPE